MLGPKLLRGLSSQSTIPATEEQLAAAKASRVMGGCVYLDVPCTTIQCTHVDLSTLKFTIYIYIYILQEVQYPNVPPLPQLAGLSLLPEVP